jgi:DnaJ family protein C protein 25
VTIVVLLLLIIGNAFSWYSQKHRWQLVANRLIMAAVEDWTPRDGGSPESKQLREQALAILAERENNGTDDTENTTTVTSENGSGKATATTTTSSKKKGAGKKVSGKERKRLEQDALLPIVTELVQAMDDFGGGFHKPTWRDLMIVSMARFPFRVARGTAWQCLFWVRRFQNLDLNDEERRVLTERAVGPVYWSVATEEDRDELVKRELWVKDNFLEWQEEQEIKNLSASEQKYYMKLKKKGKLDKLE